MSLPRIRITADAAKRLRNLDAWVFRDELLEQLSLPAGNVVEVVDERSRFVARAFYHPTAHIALRVISTAPDEELGPAFWERRLRAAIARRARITGTNARRLVFSEADALPGLIVDDYAGHLVVQFRSAGMDRLREEMLSLLERLVQPNGILERSDKEFRQEEGLPLVAQVWRGTVPPRIEIEEHGLRFLVDPHHGLKTGFFLDQRDARRRIRDMIRPGDRVLDTFSYTGGFGVACAMQGAQVTCVEQSEAFVELAKENAALNGVADRMQFVAGNAFYWLDAQASAGERFDALVLDPPSLAKTRADATTGRQALHHLLRHAIQLAREDGLLTVSICTYHLLSRLEEIVRIAASERGQRIHVVDQWPQAADHPWILQIPATRYLTTWCLRLDGPPAA